MSQIDGIIFDIETGPLPEEDLYKSMPRFTAPSNWVDAKKIEAKIQEQEEKWFSRAPLDARTGEVVAIGIADGKKTYILDANSASEFEILESFWARVTESGPTKRWIGFNIKGFDLPFLFRRSLFYGISPNVQLRHARYWDDRFIDLLDVWSCGNRDQTISLSNLSLFFGNKPKPESGFKFHKWLKTDPAIAAEYLINDLSLTANAAEKMLPWINSPEVAA
tara:strand:- start:201 stop:863 length:663 start_codon:yes stop_codon:yes gene_type:complete